MAVWPRMGLLGRAVAYLAAAVLSIAPVAATASETSQAPPSAVMVLAKAGSGYAIGAGVVVGVSGSHVRVLTARHVVQSDDLRVALDGVLYPGRLARTFAPRDLALIDVVAPAGAMWAQPARAGVLPEGGAALAIWGEDASGLELRPARLVAAAYVQPGFDGAYLAVDCTTCGFGDSGGGVFTSDGRLVGIYSGKFKTSDGTVVAIVAEPVDASFFATLP